jgi:hypothetical protein
MFGVSRRIVVAPALLVLLLGSAAWAEAPPERPQIGSWLLDCPARTAAVACMLRHQDWILPPVADRPSVALEVQARGDLLVPVVALRGLSSQAAIGGLVALKAQVALRFDPGPRADLACGLDDGAIVCAPEGPAIAATAAALPVARSVEVQIQLGLPGAMALPGHGSSLELRDTREALTRFRAAGPAGESLPAEPGLDWVGFLNRVLRAAGFAHGAAGLLPRVAGG